MTRAYLMMHRQRGTGLLFILFLTASSLGVFLATMTQVLGQRVRRDVNASLATAQRHAHNGLARAIHHVNYEAPTLPNPYTSAGWTNPSGNTYVFTDPLSMPGVTVTVTDDEATPIQIVSWATIVGTGITQTLRVNIENPNATNPGPFYYGVYTRNPASGPILAWGEGIVDITFDAYKSQLGNPSPINFFDTILSSDSGGPWVTNGWQGFLTSFDKKNASTAFIANGNVLVHGGVEIGVPSTGEFPCATCPPTEAGFAIYGVVGASAGLPFTPGPASPGQGTAQITGTVFANPARTTWPGLPPPPSMPSDLASAPTGPAIVPTSPPAGVGSFVVVCPDDPPLQRKLEALHVQGATVVLGCSDDPTHIYYCGNSLPNLIGFNRACTGPNPHSDPVILSIGNNLNWTPDVVPLGVEAQGALPGQIQVLNPTTIYLHGPNIGLPPSNPNIGKSIKLTSGGIQNLVLNSVGVPDPSKLQIYQDPTSSASSTMLFDTAQPFVGVIQDDQATMDVRQGELLGSFFVGGFRTDNATSGDVTVHQDLSLQTFFPGGAGGGACAPPGNPCQVIQGSFISQ